ncbi:MAG: penicillin acylase family protein [Calothrix sp. SM1_5_4]|nr:penicillin acylase family protein [Calothrix sp. SM1_5_4]
MLQSSFQANQKFSDRFGGVLGWDYEEPFRGMMIRRRLSGNGKLTPQDMIEIQNDAHDLQAEFLLPWLLKSLNEGGLTRAQREMIALMRRWDYKAEAKRPEPAVSKAWIAALKDALFADEYEVQGKRFLSEGHAFSLAPQARGWRSLGQRHAVGG